MLLSGGSREGFLRINGARLLENRGTTWNLSHSERIKMSLTADETQHE